MTAGEHGTFIGKLIIMIFAVLMAIEFHKELENDYLKWIIPLVIIAGFYKIATETQKD